jgi:hypothetical protein
MSERAGDAYLRWLNSHSPEESEILSRHRSHTLGLRETPDLIIMTCDTCGLHLFDIPMDVPISREALLSAGWKTYQINRVDGPAVYWHSLSGETSEYRIYGDWAVEVRFDNNPDYGREYMVFISATGTAIAARQATTMEDLDTLRRLFAVTRRNKSADQGENHE